uniref:Uncharacterized protein n=1 Tax=Romanomermis culicivorax TaxID=13658 RepID=A0A915J135_ROMCU
MQRMRTFQVNSKGAIVERGESMRRRGNSGSHQNGGVAQPKSPNTVAATSPSVDFKQPCQKFNFDLHPVVVPSINVQKCDIIIIGSSEVGKASILKQLIAANNAFRRDSDLINTNDSYSNQQQNPTIVVSVNKEEFEVTFFTVDPNKNDLWQSLCASGYVVVFAVDDPDSFKCARECVYKLRDSKFTDHVPIILAANKIDLERKRHVSNDDAKTLAKSNGCKFVELSTVLCHNVDELLVALLTKIKKQKASSASTNRSVVNRVDSSRVTLPYRSSNPTADVDNGADNSDGGGSRNGIFRRSFRKSRCHQNLEDDSERPSPSHAPAPIGSSVVQAAKPKLTATKSVQPNITLCGQNKNDQNNVVHHFGVASRQFLRKIFSGKRVQSRSAEDVSIG